MDQTKWFLDPNHYLRFSSQPFADPFCLNREKDMDIRLVCLNMQNVCLKHAILYVTTDFIMHHNANSSKFIWEGFFLQNMQKWGFFKINSYFC